MTPTPEDVIREALGNGWKWPMPSDFTPARDALDSLLTDLERLKRALAESENDGDGVALQRDDLRARLDRIRAATESDPALQGALRDFLLRETEPGVLHVPGGSGEARTELLDQAASYKRERDEARAALERASEGLQFIAEKASGSNEPESWPDWAADFLSRTALAGEAPE